MRAIVLYAASAAAALVYVLAAAARSPRGRPWPRGRTISFLAAMAVLTLIYGSGLQVYEDDGTIHVIGHMLVMMAVPPLLVFSAPVTLLLRTLGPTQRRRVVRFMNGPVMRLLNHHRAPWALCADYYLIMFIYQLTPLRTVTEESPVLHWGVHQYFLLCGLCFWFPIAGVDPVRLRLASGIKQLLVLLGLPAFALLGGIELALGNRSTGWAYVVSGAALTIGGALLVAWHGRRRARVPTPRSETVTAPSAVARVGKAELSGAAALSQSADTLSRSL